VKVSDSKALKANVVFFVILAAIGIILFGLGLNVGGTANPTEADCGISLWFIGFIGATLVLAFSK